jgi:Cytosol aminopeptidase family, catalytic domain/Cytosol aminopeptidase family, N-terminal domain
LALLSLAAQQQAHRGGGCLVAVASAFSPLGGLLRTTITSRSSSSSSSTTGALASNKMDQSFKTWSFDKPCTTMEWSEMVNAKLTFEDGSSSTSSLETATDADLVVIGVMAPAKDAETKDDDSGDDSDDSDDEKEKPAPTIVLSGLAKDIDDSLNGVLTQILEEQYTTFKNGATIGATTAPVRVVVPGSSSKAKRYVLLGLGTRPKAEPDEKAADGKEDNDETKKKTKDPWKAAGLALGKAVANSCNAKKVETAKVLLPRSGLLLSKAILLQDFATSFYEALYSDNRYRTGAKKKTAAEDLKSVTIIAETTAAVADDDATAATAGAAVVMSSDQANAALDMGRKIATGVCLTKDIVNAPHNVLNSIALADTAKRIAAECKSGRIKCQVLGKAECEKRGMGAYLGVARGSETEPQFIHLTYKPLSGTIVKKIAVIGKGLLFDTGGMCNVFVNWFFFSMLVVHVLNVIATICLLLPWRHESVFVLCSHSLFRLPCRLLS